MFAMPFSFLYMQSARLHEVPCIVKKIDCPQASKSQRQTSQHMLFAGPSEVSTPGFASRTGFAGALIYYLSVYVLQLLKPAQGLALVTTTFILHGLMSDLLKQPLDWTHPLAVVAHKIANVPMPGGQPSVKKPQSKQALPAKSSHSSTDKKKDK